MITGLGKNRAFSCSVTYNILTYNCMQNTYLFQACTVLDCRTDRSCIRYTIFHNLQSSNFRHFHCSNDTVHALVIYVCRPHTMSYSSLNTSILNIKLQQKSAYYSIYHFASKANICSFTSLRLQRRLVVASKVFLANIYLQQ